MKPFTILPALALCFFSWVSFAQDCVIKKVEKHQDHKIHIYYNLVDTIRSRTYTVRLYSSKDNFVSRLEKVSGDIGIEVKPGDNHHIVWDAKAELGEKYSGHISLEIRGQLYIPFVRVEGINKVYKRGVEYPITWTGGTQQNILNFDLYRGDEKIHPFNHIANVGKTDLEIPVSVKPGAGYYYKITDSRNKDQVVITRTFRVKRKYSLALKAVPIVILGGLVYYAIDKLGNKSGGTVSPTDDTIQHINGMPFPQN